MRWAIGRSVGGVCDKERKRGRGRGRHIQVGVFMLEGERESGKDDKKTCVSERERIDGNRLCTGVFLLPRGKKK